MNQRAKAPLDVTSSDDERIIISQMRDYKTKPGGMRYAITLTLDEAKAVRMKLGGHIALLEALANRQV